MSIQKKMISTPKMYMLLGLIIIFVIQNCLQRWHDVFQYIDEIFAILFIPLCMYQCLKKKIKIEWNREQKLFIFCTIIFMISGWAGHFYYQYQDLSNALKDAFINVKFFMAIGTSFLLFVDDDVETISTKSKIWLVINVITITLFTLCIADLVFEIFDADIRYGMRAVKLGYTAYTFLVSASVFLSAIYLWFYEEKGKKIIVPLGMLSFVMLCTRRTKAMGAVACIVFVYLVILKERKKLTKKTKIFCGVIFLVTVVAGIYQLVSYYYLMGFESARAVLTVGAPFIAWDHFPFGTGWATYGSAFSTDPYSPVYGMYRMRGVWGMSPEYHEFISDTFWPMILGQCGIFGFLAYLGMIILLVRKIMTFRYDKSAYASMLVLILYLFISSSSESAFVNPIAVPIAFWLGLLFSAKNIKE